MASLKALQDMADRPNDALGRGRWMDNVFVERLWRTVKYEHLYLHDYATPRALEAGLSGYFPTYNEERIQASLDYRTPMAVYLAT